MKREGSRTNVIQTKMHGLHSSPEGITTGFREDIISLLGHFTSVEDVNEGTTKWREETGQSGKVILDKTVNPMSQLCFFANRFLALLTIAY